MSTTTVGELETDNEEKVPHDLQHRLNRVRGRVTDQVLIAASIAGFFTLLASLSRVSLVGWRPLLYLQIACFLVVLSTTLLRGRLNLAIKVAVLIVMAMSMAIVGMVTWGLVTGSFYFFVVASLLAGLLLNWKQGALTLLYGIAFLSLEALAVQQGWWSFDVDAQAYSLAPASWANAIAVTAFFTIVLLVAQQRLYSSLYKALLEVSHLASRLEVANVTLKSEIAERIAAEKREQEIHARLEVAMTKVLSGFLPICASCKGIRDEDDQWISVERYVGARTETTFSHTLCDACVAKLYPDIDLNE